MFHNELDDNFGTNLVEDEPLVDVMALDDVLFDDLDNEFLAEHVASHKPIALAEVAPAFAKIRVTGSVCTYHEGCAVQADLVDYWAVGGAPRCAR